MRIVWKDNRKYSTYVYRNHVIKKIEEGWITDIPGDDYIYYSAEMAHNAVDKILGGNPRKANPGRWKLGIKIVGKKGGDNLCG